MRQDQIETTTTILDVRKKPGRQQIRGAVRYDCEKLLTADTLDLPLDRDRPIGVYSDNDQAAEAVVQKLHHSGFLQAAHLEGGLQAWIENGLPVEDLTQEQPIPGVSSAGIGNV